MTWKAVAGSTFCFKAMAQDVEHLYFVLNDPMDFPGLATAACICVNASTPGNRHDATCMIPENCHPFITRESFIHYRWADLRKASLLESKVGPPPAMDAFYREHDPVPQKLIRFILAKMLQSPRSSRDMKVCAQLVMDKLIGF